MTRNDMQVLIFASKHDKADNFERAKTLHKELEAARVRAKLVIKSGFNLDELTLCAKYKIVSTPTVLVLTHKAQAGTSEVLLRLRSISPASQLLTILDKLCTSMSDSATKR